MDDREYNKPEAQIKAILHWWNNLLQSEQDFITQEMKKEGPFFASTNDIVRAINSRIWSEVPGYPNQ